MLRHSFKGDQARDGQRGGGKGHPADNEEEEEEVEDEEEEEEVEEEERPQRLSSAQVHHYVRIPAVHSLSKSLLFTLLSSAQRRARKEKFQQPGSR